MNGDKYKMLTAAVLVTAFLTYSFILYVAPPRKVDRVNQKAAKGKIVWQQYNCTACHQVYGLGGFLGPDLTNCYSIKGPDYIKAFLQSGTAIMPDFHLTADQKESLVAYLQQVDGSGKADPRSFTINTNGTIEQ